MKADPSDEAARAEVHALSSGLKPAITAATAAGLDVCREACGGHGYAAVNRLGELRDDHDVWKTFEGDNTVLLQQLAAELVKAFGRRAQARGALRVAAEQLLGAKVRHKPHNPYLSPRIATGGAGSNTNRCLEADGDGGEPARLRLPPRGAAAPRGAAHAGILL